MLTKFKMQKERKVSKGFTLIELLVVIAIIGILSSIVLASLNSARGKGADAAVKADMHSIATQAAIYYDGAGAGTYGTITSCSTGLFSDPTVANILTNLGNNSTGATVCNGGGQVWAVSVPTLKGAGGTWCTDSTGYSGAKVATAGVCA